MDARSRRSELGAFLRARREGLRPADLGLPSGERRRVPGLRREEVALAASVSTDWYAWLEQGRDVRPSLPVLRRIADALRLSEEERLYLSLLAGPGAAAMSAGTARPVIPIATLQRTLDAFTRTPAILYNSRFDVLAENAAARAFYGPSALPKWEGNMIWRFFHDQDRRNMYPDGSADRGIRNLIEALRMNWARGDHEEAIGELVDEMRATSGAFDGIWRERRVARLATLPGRIRPLGSREVVEIEYARYQVPDAPGCAMAVLVPSGPAQVAALQSSLEAAR